MVLELLIYAKSAMKNFDQSEASILVMWLPKEASDWSKFLGGTKKQEKFVERDPEVGFLRFFFWNNARIKKWPRVKWS